jgi:peptidyl-prolyl cis-trans isomerase SurA
VIKYCFFFLLLVELCFAQHHDQIIASVANEPISKGEFLYAFNKNRKDSTINIDSLSRYLDRFINFKLKVKQARVDGLDQKEAYQNELNSYLSQLKKPYAASVDREDELIDEAYARMQTNILASHILIKVAPNAPPTDTLKAYNFLDSLKQTINNAEQFASAARRFSQDGSAQEGGNLGWFTAFTMVYPFETVAYQTSVNEVSEIVRTQFGYHLIFVRDRSEGFSRIRTSHIFFSFQKYPNLEGKELAEKVYDSLQNGGDWTALVKSYSDDLQTKSKDGNLPFAGLKQLPDEYLQAAFALNIADISAPVKTSFGWHIIRLDAIQSVPPLNMIRKQLSDQIKRTGRNELSELALLIKLKAKYGYRQNQKTIEKLKTGLTDEDLAKSSQEELFVLKEKVYTVEDFLRYKSPEAIPSLALLNDFEKEMILDYADSMAPIEYPTYGYLRKEYAEGLLLFEIMQKEVWNKALEDSIGQKRYYDEHIEDYKAPNRFELFQVDKSSLTDPDSTFNAWVQTPSDELFSFLEDQLITDTKALKIAKTKMAESEIASFGVTNLAPGVIFDHDDKIGVIIQRDDSIYLSMDEIRGLVISDYQEALDQAFIKQLRNTYDVEINEEILKEIVDENQ